MEVKDVAVWIGIASSIGGVAVGYGTLTEKVSTLEKATDATHLEARLTKLEVRIEDNDIGHIGKEIQQLRGEHEKLVQKVESIRIPSTVSIKSDVRLLQEQIKDVRVGLEKVGESIKAVENKPSNPLL